MAVRKRKLIKRKLVNAKETGVVAVFGDEVQHFFGEVGAVQFFENIGGKVETRSVI